MVDKKRTFVHVTHEAARKIGGIGAVLAGFFTSKKYLEKIDRSLVVGPLFDTSKGIDERLEDGKVLYSSIDGCYESEYNSLFQKIENIFDTRIVYGVREFCDHGTGVKSNAEVILFDVRSMNENLVNLLKGEMFRNFGICSDRYEDIWEFEQYVRLAPAAVATLKEMGAMNGNSYVIAHEFMGMPTALAVKVDPSIEVKTIFYAHEVAPIRLLVEKHPGHDTMFYNTLEESRESGLYIDDVFGSQDDYFKHPLVKAARFCDSICAVGDHVAHEMEFLAPDIDKSDINVVYNGIPAFKIDIDEKLKSRERLVNYSQNLFGYRPDHIFTHVTRLVSSKGLWRDLKVLERLDKKFGSEGKSGVMFLLSTQCAQRNPEDIERMERDYGWPLAHREGYPDMNGGEADFYPLIQKFNAKSRNIKAVFINQFGFEQKYCGHKMPEGMEFMDIRKGCDVEFGMSIYEPFGIAHLEALSFGAVCVISNVCGCEGFIRDVTDGRGSENVIVGDFLDYNHELENIKPKDVDEVIRREVEERESARIADELYKKLPKGFSEMQEMLEKGFEVAMKMSWDIVFGNYVSKSLEAIDNKKNIPAISEYMFN